MKIENLKVGMIIKNYKCLCEILEIKTPLSGKGKKYQLKELDRFFSYKRDGHKYIIDEIYGNPLEKNDMRSQGNNRKFRKNFKVSKENEDNIGVYAIILNNDIYIGSTTTSFRTRFMAHFQNNNPLPTKDMLEDGAKFSILEICDGLDEPMIREIENQYILKYKDDENWNVINKRDARNIKKFKVKIKYKTIKIDINNYEDAIKLLINNGIDIG